DDNKPYSFLTQCSFLIFHAIRVGYIPTLYRTIKWTELLQTINIELDLINHQTFMYQYVIKALSTKKNIIESYLKIDNNIIQNNILTNWITIFYNLTSIWFMNNKNNMID